MPSRIKKEDIDSKLFQKHDLVKIDSGDRLVSTPAGDFVYLLGKSGIAKRRRGMGL